MQFIFDLEVVAEGASTKSNAIRSSLVGAFEKQHACVCSETSNVAREMSDVTKKFLSDNDGCVRYNEDVDFKNAATVAKKLNGFGSLPPRVRNRYSLMFAKAIKFGATIVIVENPRARFSIAKACEALNIPYMSLNAFVQQYP